MRARIITVLSVCLFYFTSTSYAQEAMSKAAALAGSGKFEEAVQAYSAILRTESNNTAARLARGFVYSWKHEFVPAANDFNTVLLAEPGNREAKKGLAYIDLWSGQYKKAIRSFSDLLEKEQSAEFYIALGQAQMNAGQLKHARASFEKAGQLKPADKEIPALLAAVRTRSTLFDLDILGGYSAAGSESKTGLRWVQISSQVSPNVQLAVKYDNTLSIDNLGLLLRNRSVPYYAGSVLYNWKGKALTRLEGGARNFKGANKGEASQESQFTLEQVFFLKKNRSLKAGVAVITPDIGNTAFLLFTGYRQPISNKVTAGLSYFYANRNISNTRENRLVADADFRLPSGATINAGGYFGRSDSDNKTLTGNTYGGFLRGYFPVSHAFGIHAGIAAENNFLQTLFNANAGIRIRLEK